MTNADVLVVVQSRLASTRLPAKALLPIEGMPSVVVCALRAANTGRRVVVATSTEAADDAIVECLHEHGITVVRGAHDDVLGRFVDATSDLDDAAVVVRLTADNLFPDGAFIDDLVAAREQQQLDYLGTSSPQDGLPYGLSAEAFTVAALRRAGREASLPAEREHVTPWIRRHDGAARYRITPVGPAWSRLRCTLDTFDDYTVLRRVFLGRDPIATPWRALVDTLAALAPGAGEPRCPWREGPDGQPRSILTLGTAQWGLPYGIANRSGMPEDAELAALIAEATSAGIDSLDTARAYGSAEARIGRLTSRALRGRIDVTTKLDVLADLPGDAAPSAVRDAVEASVLRSARALDVRRIDGLLLHRWAHRHAWNGVAWATLRGLQEDGLIGRLGASVTSPAEALEALADVDVQQIQCPVNVLDSRWRSDAFLAAVRSRPEVVVHARSALLQGLLVLPASRWPRLTGVDAASLCELLDDLARDLGRHDRADLCLAYVRSLPWVSSIVIGMENLAQLRLNLAAVQRPALGDRERRAVDERVPPLPDALLDPSRWNAHD